MVSIVVVVVFIVALVVKRLFNGFSSLTCSRLLFSFFFLILFGLLSLLMCYNVQPYKQLQIMLCVANHLALKIIVSLF